MITPVDKSMDRRWVMGPMGWGEREREGSQLRKTLLVTLTKESKESPL